MAVVYDDQPPAPAVKGRIVYDEAPHVSAPEKQGQSVTDAIRSSAPYGIADIAGSGLMRLGGKVGAGYAGLGTMLGHALGLTEANPADVVHGVEDATNVQPTSPGAQKVGAALGVVAKPFQAVAAPIDRAIANAGPGVSTFVPAVSEAVQDVTSVLPLGQAARAAKAADAAAVVEGAAKPAVGDGVGTVRGAGYKVLPSDVEARMGPRPGVGQSAVEATGGAGLRRDIQLHNQGKTQELAAEDMRIAPKPKLTPEDFDKARVPHLQTYTDTGAMVDLSKPTPKVLQALQDVVSDDTLQGRVQPKVRNAINQIQARMANGTYTGSQAIKDVSTFRQMGETRVAKALEDEIGDQLAASGRADSATQLTKFQDARTQLAKIRNYQDASTGGVIDAQDFKRLSEKSPHLLTGNAKIIAQAGAELPGLTRLPAAARPKSALDQVLGLSKIATVVPKVADVVAGKIGASDLFQNRFGREMTPIERSYVPSYGRRPEAQTPQRFGPAAQIEHKPGEAPIGMGQDAYIGDQMAGAAGHPGLARSAVPQPPLALPAPGASPVVVDNAGRAGPTAASVDSYRRGLGDQIGEAETNLPLGRNPQTASEQMARGPRGSSPLPPKAQRRFEKTAKRKEETRDHGKD